MNLITEEEVTRARELMVRRDYAAALEIFQRIFNGRDAAIASHIGFIYDQKDFELYNANEALRFYLVAAEQGDTYAMHSVGGLMREKGNLAEAAEWYAKGSALDDAGCSFARYLLAKQQGDFELANTALQLAASQGHVVAKQLHALACLSGKYGIVKIIPGIVRYFKNVPALIRHSKQNVE